MEYSKQKFDNHLKELLNRNKDKKKITKRPQLTCFECFECMDSVLGNYVGYCFKCKNCVCAGCWIQCKDCFEYFCKQCKC